MGVQLLGLVQKLRGQRVKFELKSGAHLEGIVDLVDSLFTIYLSQVVYSPQATATTMTYLHSVLRGSAVRSIILPGSFDCDARLCALKAEHNRGKKK